MIAIKLAVFSMAIAFFPEVIWLAGVIMVMKIIKGITSTGKKRDIHPALLELFAFGFALLFFVLVDAWVYKIFVALVYLVTFMLPLDIIDVIRVIMENRNQDTNSDAQMVQYKAGNTTIYNAEIVDD